MADIATMRMKALHFWDKHGISAASEAFGVSCRTLYWWRQLLNGRMIATAHDKMRMIPVRLSSRGKALLVKKRTTNPPQAKALPSGKDRRAHWDGRH